MSLPKIGITQGDPAGIGPEIVLKALKDKSLYKICQPEVIEPRDNAYQALKNAAKLCLEKKISAIVTAPVNKHKISLENNVKFLGHTSFLKQACEEHYKQSFHSTMFFSAGNEKLALVTEHIALKDVSTAITPDRLQKTILNVYNSLKKDFLINDPRIAILGLNPHAGEQGLIGSEEKEIFTPTVDWAKKEGILLEGPFNADSFFPLFSSKFHAVIANYHDQGLIPFKLKHLHSSVNVTLGLPIIRTSVDHGVGYDISGKNMANEQSLVEAIRLAAEIIHRRKDSVL